MCIGVFAFAGLPLLRWFGPKRVVSFSLAAITVGTLLRAGAPDSGLIVALTCMIGVGIALTGTALPGIVKTHFADRPGAVTGGYVAALSAGSGLAALAVVPLSELLGSWRWAFVVSAIPPLATLALWAGTRTGDNPGTGWPGLRRAAHPFAEDSLRPQPVALRLGVIYALQSTAFIVVISWVAALYRDLGWSPGMAALTTAVIPMATIPASLIIPRLSDGHDRRVWLLGTSFAMGVGTLGLAFAPTAAPWLWLGIFAMGSGSQLALSLTLPLDLREDQAGIANLTAWMLALGHLIAAPAAVVAGALRDFTGDFTIALAIFGTLAIISGLVAQTSKLRPVGTAGRWKRP
jgi:CP family cyanate transporter-like MFS transporter